MALRHFLLIYDVANRTLMEAVDVGGNARKAADTYSEYEERYRGRDGFEIVLIGADSLDTIRVTHSHYFRHADEDVLAELLAPELS
jgi:hypothetical protein